MRLFAITTFALLTLSSSSCTTSSPPIDEACEHLTEGPASAVSAVEAGDGPLIADDHRRYDVALVPVTTGYGGRVRFSAHESGDFIFHLGVNVPVRFTDASGTSVLPEKSEMASTSCPALQARHVVPLAVGTFHLEFGPSSASAVSVVVEPGGAHAE
jgi:hypothetical protein